MAPINMSIHMKIDDNLSEIFDVTVIPEHDVIKADGTLIPPDTNVAQSDFDKVRANLHDILEYGNQGLRLAISVATSTEEPKAIEAFTKLFSELSNVNLKLLEIHEKQNKLRPKDEPAEMKGQIVQNQQNNNIFVGTTADLGKFIHGLDK